MKASGIKTLSALAAFAALGAMFTACNSSSDGGTEPPPGGGDSVKAYSRTITLAALDSTSNDSITNYQLLVRLSSTADSTGADALAGAGANGAKLRFFTQDSVVLPHQVEAWSATEAAIWVRVPKVKLKSATTLVMAWGDTVPAAASGSVFTAADGYVSVWHLGDAPAAEPRPNQIAGAPTALLKNFGMPTTEDPEPVAYTPKGGVVGFADSLRGGAGDDLQGTKDFIDLNRRGYEGFSDFNTGFTFSAWIYSNGPLFAERFIEILDDTTSSASSDTRIILFGNRTDPVPNGVSVRWGSSGTFNSAIENLYTGNEWYHFVFTKEGGSAPMRIYRNGVLADITGDLPDLNAGLRNYVYMGRSSVTASDPYFQGKFDEVRISKVPRTAGWAKLDYETQRIGATAVRLGSTETHAWPKP